jgi:hypothetical protein
MLEGRQRRKRTPHPGVFAARAWISLKTKGMSFCVVQKNARKCNVAANLGKKECREMLERQTGGFGGVRVGWAMRKGMRADPFRVVSR